MKKCKVDGCDENVVFGELCHRHWNIYSSEDETKETKYTKLHITELDLIKAFRYDLTNKTIQNAYWDKIHKRLIVELEE